MWSHAGSFSKVMETRCSCVCVCWKLFSVPYVCLAEPSRWCSFGAKERSARQLPCHHSANCFSTPDKAVILLERNKLRDSSVDWPWANYNQNDTTGTSDGLFELICGLTLNRDATQKRMCFHRAKKLLLSPPSVSKSHYENSTMKCRQRNRACKWISKWDYIHPCKLNSRTHHTDNKGGKKYLVGVRINCYA